MPSRKNSPRVTTTSSPLLKGEIIVYLNYTTSSPLMDCFLDAKDRLLEEMIETFHSTQISQQSSLIVLSEGNPNFLVSVLCP